MTSLVIGRRGGIDPYYYRKIEADVPDIFIITYDDLITKMKAKVEALKKGKLRID